MGTNRNIWRNSFHKRNNANHFSSLHCIPRYYVLSTTLSTHFAVPDRFLRFSSHDGSPRDLHSMSYVLRVSIAHSLHIFPNKFSCDVTCQFLVSETVVQLKLKLSYESLASLRRWHGSRRAPIHRASRRIPRRISCIIPNLQRARYVKLLGTLARAYEIAHASHPRT